MPCLELPLPEQPEAPAFADRPDLKAWLALQPQADSEQMLRLLCQQVEAIDASGLPPAQRLDLLDALRPQILTVQSASDSRFLRKPLPMPPDDFEVFQRAHRLWRALMLAYLRLSRSMAADEAKAVPLHRAAIACRMAVFCHLQAAIDVPPFLIEALLAIRDEARAAGCLEKPVADPDFTLFGESSLAGHLAWAALLLLINPYQLSAVQLAVANRAFSRWRDLAAFLEQPDPDPRARTAELQRLLPGTAPNPVAGWLDVRSVTRKMRQRIDALKKGETPESLSLGKELSADACLRLLREMDSRLCQGAERRPGVSGEVVLVFGAEPAYALFNQRFLNPPKPDPRDTALAHQRMAVFGFDRASEMPDSVKRKQLALPGETWVAVDGLVQRPADAGERRLAPCLVAARADLNVPARLGVLGGLKLLADGHLQATLTWFGERVEAGSLVPAPRGPGMPEKPKVAVFVLFGAEGVSLIVPPTAGVRPGEPLALDGTSVAALIPAEVLARGVDFVRYACRQR
jgi:hypothetical protein